MRRLFAPRMLLAALAVLAGSLLAPTGASARSGPPAADAVVKAGAPGFSTSTAPTTGRPIAPTTHQTAALNSVFSCTYGGRAPFYSVDFLCTVTSGSIKLFLDCTDYPRIFSVPLPAPGTYRQTGTCGPPRQVVNFGAVDA